MPCPNCAALSQINSSLIELLQESMRQSNQVAVVTGFKKKKRKLNGARSNPTADIRRKIAAVIKEMPGASNQAMARGLMLRQEKLEMHMRAMTHLRNFGKYVSTRLGN